jgi:formylglycine-generating enzyme required for sulfatase activity
VGEEDENFNYVGPLQWVALSSAVVRGKPVGPAIISPTIVAQPQAVTVTAGQMAVFTVTAAGTAPLSYQWQKDGANVAGATAATYTVAKVQNSDSGTYRVVVSNEAGAVTSDTANLMVIGGPVIAEAKATAVVRGGFVTGVSVTDGGNGYTIEPTVTLIGGGGTGAVAKAFIENGRVVEILVIRAGSGYTSAPEVRVSPPPVEGVSLSLRMVAAVAMDGIPGVDRIVEWSPGPDGPWAAWTNGVRAPSQKEWIDFGGDGRLFRVRPVGGANRAVAEGSVRAGYVSAVVVKEKGSGYANPPEVTLSGGGGSGATAAAILEGDQVGWVVVVNAGGGYGTAPTVTIAPPPEALGVPHRWIPALKVKGSQGTAVRWETGETVLGPWMAWADGVVGPDGMTMADLSPEAMNRFYRVGADPVSGGASGFVWIPPGTFVMGSPSSEEERWNDEVQHTVTLAQGFWLSDHEVTQAEYQAVMGNNPSSFKGDMNRPVETVSWDEAVLYCQRLTERERAAGRITAQQAYRLPTEAEWEYAARAGSTGARHGYLHAIAWNGLNSGRQTHPVKEMAPNAWGLYDMIGNVWEWCSDWYGNYPTGSVTDPRGPSSGFGRVSRGGGWSAGAWSARSAHRFSWLPGLPKDDLGFRPVLSSVR